MVAVRIYTGNGIYVWASLSKDLEILKPENITTDVNKLDAILVKEKEFDKKITGVVDSKNLRLKFKSDGKYTGIIWSSRTSLSGKYTNV